MHGNYWQAKIDLIDIGPIFNVATVLHLEFSLFFGRKKLLQMCQQQQITSTKAMSSNTLETEEINIQIAPERLPIRICKHGNSV